MVRACSDHGSLEVVDEGPLEVLPGVDGVWFETFKPSEGHGFQGCQTRDYGTVYIT
jgi:hypothetical protein